MTDTAAWLRKYDDARHNISDSFRAFLLEEDSANAIGALQKNVIPGLLQTPEYARSIMEEYDGAGNVSTFGVQLRLERQERVRARGVTPFFVVTPSALRRRVGTYATWRDQLLTIKTYPTLYVVSTAVADSLADVDSFTLLLTDEKMTHWSELDVVTHGSDDPQLCEARSDLLDDLISYASNSPVAANIIDEILKENGEY